MDVEKLIIDNIGLVYMQLHKFHLAYDEEAYSYAIEALFKAAKSYDNTKGFAFSTYAGSCIYNNISMYLRHKCREARLPTISFEDRVTSDADNELNISDMLCDYDTPETELLNAELYEKLWECFDKVFSTLTSEVSRAIIAAWRESEFTITQMELSKKAGTSQANVSRTLGAFKHKLKKEMEDYLCGK